MVHADHHATPGRIGDVARRLVDVGRRGGKGLRRPCGWHGAADRVRFDGAAVNDHAGRNPILDNDAADWCRITNGVSASIGQRLGKSGGPFSGT